MILAAISNLLKTKSTKLDYRLNAIKILSQLVLAKCNNIIKLFLEVPMLKIFMTSAHLSKQVKDGKLPEEILFSNLEAKERDLRRQIILETLKSVEDWKHQLEKDHKGKPTYFLMIYRAIFEPNQIVIAEEAKTLPDYFVPTEDDIMIKRFNELSDQYQSLLNKFNPSHRGVNKQELETAVSPVLNKALDVQKSLRDIRSSAN